MTNAIDAVAPFVLGGILGLAVRIAWDRARAALAKARGET